MTRPLLRRVVLAAILALAARPTNSGAVPSPGNPVTHYVPATPERIAVLREWNQRTLAGDYDRVGGKDAKWDTEARKALELFASTRDRSTNKASQAASAAISNHVARAVAAGCTDPLVRYVHARWVDAPATADAADLARIYDAIAEEGSKGSLHPIRKFYFGLRAYQSLVAATGSTKVDATINRLFGLTFNPLKAAAEDPGVPEEEIFEAVDQMLEETDIPSSIRSKVYTTIEPSLQKNWPDSVPLLIQRGQFYINHAWRARGSGTADTVKESDRKLFEERLDRAQEALEKAWKLNPRVDHTAVLMMRVELGQGEGRERMEQWFRRAMEVNPNSYEACSAKLYYLAPKWYGSFEDQLKFGLECARSTRWGGSVPMILLRAHMDIAEELEEAEAARYWKRPAVWQGTKACFDAYIAAHPEGSGWRNNYAFIAYKCGQLEEFRRQIALLKPVRYSTFGGKAAFEKMRKEAESAAETK